jgi:hypothetical protein
MKNFELKRGGENFLGILNDLKRRPEDASRELGIPLEQIQKILDGEIPIPDNLVQKAVKIWPINSRDFYLIHDDCPNGVKIMTNEESEKTKRIMNRSGKPYYEYRDTATSSVGPFRPEWILELCEVDDNDPYNSDVQWNNGHFMHQFTYFIGDVNFYYMEKGQKKIAVMNTGDSMYITPFTPHTFTTRKGASEKGLILALTYGNNLSGDSKQELSAIGVNLGSLFALDFSSKKSAFSELLKFHMSNCSIGIEELSIRSQIEKLKIKNFFDGKEIPNYDEYELISKSLKINVKDLLPMDDHVEKVSIQKYEKANSWSFTPDKISYRMVELASSLSLPFSKAFEITIEKENNDILDLQMGLHQYGYNVGTSKIILTWELNGQLFNEIIDSGSSFYMKPFVRHSFSGPGKLLILRIGGKVTGSSQQELSVIGKNAARRAITESLLWFNNNKKNNSK